MEDVYSKLFYIATGKRVQLSNIKNENTIQQIQHNRIIDPILKNYPSITINNNNWASLSMTKDKRLTELKIIIKEFNENNIPFMIIKGLAMTKYYPSQIERQYNDFDFLLKNINDYWTCHNILKKLGYQQTINPMFTKSNGNVRGIIKYIKQLDSTTDIKLEFSLGGFIIAEVTWFDKHDIWDTMEKHSFSGLEFYIPNDTINMLILILETSDRVKFFIRDIVDFYYLNTHGDIDWQYIKKITNDPYLASVIKKLNKTREAIAKGSFRYIHKKVKGFQREYNHILPSIIREKNSFRKIYLRYLKRIGDRFSSRDQFLGFIRKFDRIMSPKTRFDSGIITHFILMDSEVKGNLEWIKFKGYYLAKTPIGTFWATNFAILEEEEEDDIKNFIKKELTTNETSFFK